MSLSQTDGQAPVQKVGGDEIPTSGHADAANVNVSTNTSNTGLPLLPTSTSAISLAGLKVEADGESENEHDETRLKPNIQNPKLPAPIVSSVDENPSRHTSTNLPSMSESTERENPSAIVRKQPPSNSSFGGHNHNLSQQNGGTAKHCVSAGNDSAVELSESTGSNENIEHQALEPSEYFIQLSSQRKPAPQPSFARPDDDSNQYFMSEPSVSEEEHSQRVRAPHGLLATGRAFQHYSYSDHELDGDGAVVPDGAQVIAGPLHMRPTHQSNQHQRGGGRPADQQSPGSPGNTSISSWDISPARNKMFFHFGPPSRTNSMNSAQSASPSNRRDGRQPQPPAVVMEKGPNGQPQVRINSIQQQPQVQQQQQPPTNKFFPDNMAPPLTFDCIDSPSHPQQRKTGRAVSSLSSNSFSNNRSRHQKMIPLMQAMASSSGPARQHEQLRRQPSLSSEDDNEVLYERQSGSGSEVERMLKTTAIINGLRDNKSNKLQTPPSDAQSIVMTFSDSDDDCNDKGHQVILKSNILSTNQHSRDSNNDIIEYQKLSVEAKQPLPASDGGHGGDGDDAMILASSISSQQIQIKRQTPYRGGSGRRRPRPPTIDRQTSDSSTGGVAASERPPRSGVYRPTSTSSVSSNSNSAATAPTATATAPANPATSGSSSAIEKTGMRNHHHQHRRAKSTDTGMKVAVRKNSAEDGVHDNVCNTQSADPVPAGAAGAVTSGNSSGGSVGSSGRGRRTLRHRRSRSGDAAAASLMGSASWKGMESLMGATTSDSSTGISNGDRPPRSRYNNGGSNKLSNSASRDSPATGGPTSNSKMRHRRSRSGDAAAASLMTGGQDWKGMHNDNIPLPSVCSSGSHEDDDEDEETVPDEMRAIIAENSQPKVSSGFGVGSDVSSLGSEKVGAGTAPPPPMNGAKQSNLETSQVNASQGQSRQTVTFQSEGTGLLPTGQTQFSRANSGPCGYGSMPSPKEQQYMFQQQQQQQQYHHQHSFAGQSWSSLSPPLAEFHRLPPASDPPHSLSWMPSPPPPPPRHLPQNQFLAHIRNSHLGESWTYSPGDDAGNGVRANEDFDYGRDDPDSADSDRPFMVQENRLDNLIRDNRGMSLRQIEQRYEDRKERGSYQAVMRRTVSDSPFANLGKTSAGKAKRSAFLPQTMFAEEEDNQFPTYICPRCKTRQRAFFSVADAPKQVEGPGGYLALYFAIYVISSLFIFGLEEGWKPLDCVYFAVITLTTAGLGDFVPTTNANKIICSIFIYFGVACIGLLLGSYIAGMLDDRASRDATERQLNSCPNCARIQTIKETAAARQVKSDAVDPAQPMGTPGLRKKSPRQMSERIGAERMNSMDDHTAVYVPRHHHRHHQEGDEKDSSPSVQQRRTSSPSHFSGGGSVDSQIRKQFELSSSPRTDESANKQRPQAVHQAVPPPPPPPTISTYHPQTPTQNKTTKQAAILGSPMTRQILARQKHSRHESFDISNKPLFGPMSARKYSADVPGGIPSFMTPQPTINEGIPLIEQTAAAAPSLPFVGQNDQSKNYSQRSASNYGASTSSDGEDSDEDSDDESTASASSSDSLSTMDEIADERLSRIKTAKWVFLTLRQALVNSLVIIAVGCVGFWLIEGFSLVDSWYFTTVLLTTVGYGDIVPITRGGKLFATTYILVAGTVLLNNMSLISMIPLELRKRRIERAVLTQFGEHLDDAALRELATGPVVQRLCLKAQRTDGLDECTREMFALAMLVRLGKVTEQDIKETFASFRRLDVNNEGVLNSKSIIAGMIARRRNISVGRSLNTMGTRGSATNNSTAQQPPPPPYPPTSSHAPPAYQHNAQAYWDDMDGPVDTGPPLAETLPPFHYNRRDPEARVAHMSQDFSLGGEYWFQDGGDSSSYDSSESSSPDQ